MHEKFTTVAIALPGARQESLRAMLSAVDHIELVGVAGGALNGWHMVRELAPMLVVIEGSLPDEEISRLLKCVNDDARQVATLVLTLSRRQQEAVIAAGASAVLAGQATLNDLNSVVGAVANGMVAGRH